MLGYGLREVLMVLVGLLPAWGTICRSPSALLPFECNRKSKGSHMLQRTALQSQAGGQITPPPPLSPALLPFLSPPPPFSETRSQ